MYKEKLSILCIEGHNALWMTDKWTEMLIMIYYIEYKKNKNKLFNKICIFMLIEYTVLLA